MPRAGNDLFRAGNPRHRSCWAQALDTMGAQLRITFLACIAQLALPETAAYAAQQSDAAVVDEAAADASAELRESARDQPSSAGAEPGSLVIPRGAPPSLRPADPQWNETEPAGDAGVEEVEAPTLSRHRNLAFGGQWFFAQDKIMPGLALRGGHRWAWLHLEKSFVFINDSRPDWVAVLAGSQFGVYLALSPLNVERGEIHVGAGSDVYWLYGIHGDLAEVAFSVRASGHVWLSHQLGLFASARGYLLASRGLELGTTRDYDARLPVLLSLGMEWRPR
jgi:hypothetical protein